MNGKKKIMRLIEGEWEICGVPGVKGLIKDFGYFPSIIANH